MQIKLLQLNINAGSFFHSFENFLKTHEFDILCLQELAGVNTRCGNINCTVDCYEKLSSLLSSTHKGELAIAERFTSDPADSYLGNAIFYRKEFTLLEKNIVWLYKKDTPFLSEMNHFEEQSRNVLHLNLSYQEKNWQVVTTHLAWAKTPEEYPHQTAQNKILLEKVSTLTTPWIVTGDFNLLPNQPTVSKLESMGKNLTKDYGVNNTLDSVNHRSWERIKPGFPVDYIFVSPDIKVADFKALSDVHFSDHIGLMTTLEI